MNKFLNEKNLDILLSLALLMLFVPALLPLFDMEGEWMIYVYTAGAILAVLSRVLQRAAYRKDKSIPLDCIPACRCRFASIYIIHDSLSTEKSWQRRQQKPIIQFP